VIEVEVVRGALGRLGAAGAAREGGPEREAAIGHFAAALSESLAQDVVPCVIEVGPERFHYGGVEVGGQDLVSGRLLAGLHGQGLRVITLLPGCPLEELVLLAALLGRDWVDGAEDLEAEAWRLALGHVHLEMGTRSLISEADGAKVRSVELVRRLLHRLGLEEEALEDGVAAEVGMMMSVIRRMQEIAPPAAVPLPPGEPTAELLRALDRVQRGHDADLDRVSLVVFEAARTALTDGDTGATVARGVRQALDRFADGDPAGAAALFRRWLLLADGRLPLPDARRAACRAALRGLLSGAAQEAVAAGFVAHPVEGDWVGPLFSLGQVAAADELPRVAAIAAELPAGALHQALADGLLRAVEREGGPIRGLLVQADDAALPVVLRMARRSADVTLVEPLTARLGHPDPMVREAALVSLRGHRSRRISELVRGLVADPARGVRMEALRYTSVYREEDAVPGLVDRLREAAPPGVDADELRALALTLARAGGEALAPTLEELAGSGRGLRHPGARVAALQGLHALGEPGRAALDRLARAHEDLRPDIRSILGGGR
jgi:hypothetical protein